MHKPPENLYIINGTYECRRAKQDGLILVFNPDALLMVEYSERTGKFRWQRVLPATQKASVEKWITDAFPVTDVAHA